MAHFIHATTTFLPASSDLKFKYFSHQENMKNVPRTVDLFLISPPWKISYWITCWDLSYSVLPLRTGRLPVSGYWITLTPVTKELLEDERTFCGFLDDLRPNSLPSGTTDDWQLQGCSVNSFPFREAIFNIYQSTNLGESHKIGRAAGWWFSKDIKIRKDWMF